MLAQAMLFGLPALTVLAFLLVWSLLLVAYVLYRIDMERADGYISIFGWRGE